MPDGVKGEDPRDGQSLALGSTSAEPVSEDGSTMFGADAEPLLLTARMRVYADQDGPLPQGNSGSLHQTGTETSPASKQESGSSPDSGSPDGSDGKAGLAPAEPVRMQGSAHVPVDRELLRSMVADLVREELRGSTGERITDSIRRFVNRELQQALATRDRKQTDD